jgi:hypothetical protein
MADSISADSLPPGYDAYAGYVDGAWPDFPAIAAKFPTAYLYSISATGQPADEYDVEIGDLSPASGVAHVQADLAAGKWRPGIYASVSTMASGVLPALAAAGVARESSRLRSAHYGAGEHICGPATCNLVSIAMDATQWTDSAPGVGGALIDASILVITCSSRSPTRSTRSASRCGPRSSSCSPTSWARRKPLSASG